jgi:guanine deaminase
MGATGLLRGTVMHVPRDPFEYDGALEAFDDGALALKDGRVLEAGDYAALRRRYPGAAVDDRRGAVVLPGLVDAHVHYPQVPVLGAVGMRLLAWLERRTLPEEARYADADYAAARADVFLRLLAAGGTTTALVFGAHFAPAMERFFQAAERSGLRIAAGLTVADRNLRAELHTTPERALADGLELARRWHGRGRLRYAVTPRFALSAGEDLLGACGELLRALPGLLFTTHLNESREEIEAVRGLFPWADDYLATYERFGLVGERSLFAHDVHPRQSELERLAAASATVVHCPTSNVSLGSGLFPLRRHLDTGVRLALGTDVGAGTGFGVLKEALAAHQVQMLREDGAALDPTRLLHLATGAGARALGLGGVVGDFLPGREADLVVVRPQQGSTLAEVLAHAEDASSALAALITLAREESVEEVRVGDQRVHGGPPVERAGLDADPPAGP